nr:unnamed protein product [Callosobruchus analis]
MEVPVVHDLVLMQIRTVSFVGLLLKQSFETLLHISHNLPFKLWQVRGEENKAELLLRKREVQKTLRSKWGYLYIYQNLDMVEQTMETPLGVLRIIASGKKINIDKFDLLTKQTRDLYLQHYSWYYMPSTLHKLLVHGKDVISNFDLPTGNLSEEALEARHKEIRKNRLSYTRKTSRVNSSQDLMKILLLTSDLLISSLRKTTSKKNSKVR